MLIQYLRSMPVQEAVRRTVPVIAGTAISFAFFQQKFQSNMPGTLSSEWRSAEKALRDFQKMEPARRIH